MIIPPLQNSTTTVNDGRADVRRAAGELADRLPEPLAPLARLAYNYRWSWLAGGPELFRSIDPERFEIAARRTPSALLQEAPARALRRAAGDERLVERAASLEAQVIADLERPPSRRDRRLGRPGGVPVRRVRGARLAAGLLRRARRARRRPAQGGLRPGGAARRASGSCTARATSASASTPAAGSTSTGSTPTPSGCRRRSSPARDGTPLTIEVPIDDADVTARIWRVDVGRVPLFLLDTDFPDNGPLERWITARLYDGDERHQARAVRAARGRRRPGAAGAGDRAGRDPPQRGPRGARAAGARRARGQREATCEAARERGPCSRRTRRSRPATTPIRREQVEHGDRPASRGSSGATRRS